MRKVVLLIAIGIAIGYQIGYGDASKHRAHLMSRIVARVGGSNRGAYATDFDRQMNQAEK